ncbi:hypothetical protein C0J52_26398, partial [Blattella germanica]
TITADSLRVLPQLNQKSSILKSIPRKKEPSLLSLVESLLEERTIIADSLRVLP